MIPRLFIAISLLWLVSLGETKTWERGGDRGKPQLKCHDETFVPDAILRVSEVNKTQACLPSKAVVVVNGTTPGPELRIREGKTCWIRVYNDMSSNNLTMHWHGLSMALSPFSDGTPLASQWPIPPSHFFDYEIHVPIGMAGTYFYHSHVGFQAVSASGPLIVDHDEHKNPSPYTYDDEKIIFIQDTFNKSTSAIESGLIASPLSWSGEAASILVNGLGGGSFNGSACSGGEGVSSIEVERGKTYRLRFIGATALTFTSLTIEGHEGVLEVIEAEGSYTQPVNTFILQIAPGQRYSLLLHTLENPTKEQYTIQLESRERPLLTRSFAILNYGSAPTTPITPPSESPPPLTLPPTILGFLDYQLHPFYQESVNSIGNEEYQEKFPTKEEVTRTVTIKVHQSVHGPTIWLENAYPWTETYPSEPYLVSLYLNDSIKFPSMERALENNGIDPVTRAFPAMIGETIDIVLQNTGADGGGLDAHPFHAHGSHYWDLGSGNGTYNATENEAKWAGIEGGPVMRDTTMLYRYKGTAGTGNGTEMGWRAWRLKVTEPGAWMVHCHILQHMIMGMQTLWVMGNETELLGRVPKPEVEGYLVYGGSVVGNETHLPIVLEWDDLWVEET